MEPRQIIGTGFTASAIAHLSALALVIFFSEVHPFSSVTAESVTVDLVSPDELKPPPSKEEPLTIPKTVPTDAFNLASQSAPPVSPPPAAPPAAAVPPQQAAVPPQQAAVPPQQAAPAKPRSSPQQANAAPQATRPQPATTSPSPAYAPPEPDLSVKYHVLLGLPPASSASRLPGETDKNFDAPASTTADIASSRIAEFRRHLKTCSKLPAAIAPSDEIEIKLRVFMTPEGRLAAEPFPIGVKHPSENGPALLQSAIAALHACEPYQMLPADRYGEWKVLDLNFTPRDFVGG
jgi:hypothetical protein